MTRLRLTATDQSSFSAFPVLLLWKSAGRVHKLSLPEFRRSARHRYSARSLLPLKSFFIPGLPQNHLSLFVTLHQTYGIDPPPTREYIRHTLKQICSEPERI